MRKSVPFAAALAVAAAAIGAGVWASQPCRPLDRLFGWSGCVGSFKISDLASLRRTLAFDPARPERLYVAGVAYQGYAHGDRLRSRSTLAALDFPSGAERWRKTVEPNGLPETLVVSPGGSHAALTCNRLTRCDFAPNLAPGRDRDAFAPVAVVDLAKAEAAKDGGEMAKAQWMRPVALTGIPMDADGRSAEPRFSVDGARVSASGAAWSLDGDDAAVPESFASLPGGWDEAALPANAGSVIHDRRASALIVRDGAGAKIRRIKLELPDDFETALHAPLAVSADGTKIAVLSRRFSGPGEARAILQAFRIADGVRLSRVALDVEMSPALLFSPDGTRLLVATAPEPAPKASVTVRIYPAGGGQ